MKKKVVSLLMVAAMVASMAGCGSNGSTNSNSNANAGSDSNASNASSNAGGAAAGTEATGAEDNGAADTASDVEKPEEITMMVDGTVFTEENGQAEFIAKLEELTGIKINVIQPDHDAYYDVVGQTIASGEWPDVIILGSTYYAGYAAEGVLWDMSEAYENSELKQRQDAYGSTGVVDGVKIDGKLYGMPAARGNGCVTYVKKAWFDNVGLSADDIKTFDDYYNMLLKFHNEDPDGNGIDGDTYGVVAAGYMGNEAPWINYMPEFWQDAYPAIYQDETGAWVDGFNTDATKAAIERIAKGVAEGAIDPESLTASTKIAREKWFSNDQTGSSGVFTYWAGSWYQTLTDNLVKNNVDSELVMLKPIAEVGAYINREAPVWVIIDDGDGDDSREQAIFDAFIETMMDGDKVQTLWTYGAEDVHWSTHAEKFTTNAGTDKAKDYSYEEGQFHLKQSPNDANSVWKKNAMDPALVISPLTNGYVDISSLAAEGNLFFTENCKDAPASPSCETYTEHSGDIYTAQLECITKVVNDGVSVDDAMDAYIAAVGEYVDAILAELNAQ